MKNGGKRESEIICIKAAAEEDIPGVWEIEREAISPSWSHDALLDETYRDDTFFAVATIEFGIRNSEFGNNGGVLGFVILRRMADEGELLQIAVRKDARRRHVADMLMSAALDYAADQMLSSVFLEVRKSNEAAMALYKKHGFVFMRTRHDYYADPIEDAIVLVRVP